MVDYLFAFPHRYQAEVLDELPGANPIPTFYFPGASQKGGRDGLLVSVRPDEAEAWLGIFAFGGYKSVTVLSSTPDPDILFVVSRGAGYYVRANDPKAWTKIAYTIPITDKRIILDREMIVLVDFTSIAARRWTHLENATNLVGRH